jgi:hypothetical protein
MDRHFNNYEAAALKAGQQNKDDLSLKAFNAGWGMHQSNYASDTPWHHISA